MRCPKPKVRGSINQLLPTGPLGTGDSGMGRVIKPEDRWFVEPSVQELLFCFGLCPFSRLLRHAGDTADQF